MPRKKKEQVNEVIKDEKYFTYCDNMKCKNLMCLRRHKNAPWNVVIHEKRFQLNDDGSCNYIKED